MLPLSFNKLGKLVRLHAERVELPDGVSLGNMKSLRELVGICLTLHVVTEIGKLGELKVLKLVIHKETKSSTVNPNELVRMCLQMCPSSLQVLVLRTLSSPLSCTLDFMAQVPSILQTFMSNIYFSAFPRWIIDLSLSCLTVLSIMLWHVRVQQKHLDKLAELPSLRFLRIQALLIYSDRAGKAHYS